MEDEVKYRDWPQSVKILTGLTVKNTSFRMSHWIPTVSGFVIFVFGLLSLNYNFYENEMMDWLLPLSFMFIGVVNIMNGRMLKWIENNSSWEERYKHTSSSAHKIIHGGLFALLMLCVFIMIKN